MLLREHFAQADCTLWRVTPVDVRAYEQELRAALIEAWRSGQGGEQAINGILHGEIGKQLLREAEESFGKRRRVLLDREKTEAERRLHEEQDLYAQNLDRINANYGTAAKNAYDESTAAEESMREREQKKSLIARRLAELNNRVSRRLKEIGGSDAIDLLHSIDDDVLGTEAPYDQQTEGAVRAERAATRAARGERNTGSIEDTIATVDELVEEETIPKFFRRNKFLKTVYKVFNYELW